MDHKLIRALNTWRVAQPEPLDPEPAIITLLRRALVAEGHLDNGNNDQDRADPAVERLIAAFEDAAGK